VESKLPDDVARVVVKEMRAAYANPDALAAQGALEALARRIERSHPGAAGSLREGLAETLTIARLGVPPTLARTLRSTNAVESMIEICRDHSRNVKNWRDGEMALRWCAAGMVEAKKQFPTGERSPASEGVAHRPRTARPRDCYTPSLQCRQGGGRLTQKPGAVTQIPHRSGHPPWPAESALDQATGVTTLRSRRYERDCSGRCSLGRRVHPTGVGNVGVPREEPPRSST
jgi:Transposase, Mutator family